MVAVGGRKVDEQEEYSSCRRWRKRWEKTIGGRRRVLFGLLAGVKIVVVWSPLVLTSGVSTMKRELAIDTHRLV